MTSRPFRYRWAALGDLNGFFALSIDNLALLAGMSGLLVGVFKMPAELIFDRMVPGTALGVLVGDALYAWLAFRLAKREKRSDVCAMPLGIDTPSMFALCLGVIGPAFVATHDARAAWAVGMAVLFLMGCVKLMAAFFGQWIREALPRTALLGALSAVAVALIMFYPVRKVFAEPIGGFVALGVVLLALVGRVRLPRQIPAMLVSLGLGFAAIALARMWGYSLPPGTSGAAELGWHWPWPSLYFLDGLSLAWQYLPLAVPVALATVIGGIDNTESAALAGDAYSTRAILLVEAASTLVQSVCGGVIQTTPYIGHPAYKAMGCRAAYALATGLFIGLGAATGVISYLITLLPESLIVPILVFVGLEMGAQAVHASEARHVRALGLALIPVLAYLCVIQISGVVGEAHLEIDSLSPGFRHDFEALTMLGNGFIISAMLWASWLIWVIDARFGRAAGLSLLAAALTLFGVIHSPYPDGRLLWPGAASPPAVFALAAAYGLLALLCAGAAFLGVTPRGESE
ncbi:MAG: hypothetical protein ABSF50_01605 [Burkholderiaceae bacterium]|jgi:AGZA family xanthine/uracil permease-like MFS transporter